MHYHSKASQQDFFKEMNTFIQPRSIKLFKRDSEDIYKFISMVQTILSFPFIKEFSRIASQVPQKYIISTLIIIHFFFFFLNVTMECIFLYFYFIFDQVNAVLYHLYAIL